LKINVEIEPTTKKDKIIEFVSSVKDFIHCINVPDNPLGQPKASALAIAILLKNLGVNPVLHIKAADRNFYAIKSEMLGAYYLFDINNFLIVRGDTNFYEKDEIYNKFKLETIVDKIKSNDKLSNVKIGLPLMSFLSSKEKIIERINSKADFLVLPQIMNVKELNYEIVSLTKKNNKELHAYYLIDTDNNKSILYELGLIKEMKVRTIEEHVKNIIEFEGYVDTLILSCPKDIKSLVDILSKVHKR
jgi:hypothetical protein